MAHGVLRFSLGNYMSDVEQSEPPLTASNRMQHLRVLLVEDSELDALLLVRYLHSNGYATQHERVANQQEMEKALAEKEWDVVLCSARSDPIETQGAGFAVHRRLRRHRRGTGR